LGVWYTGSRWAIFNEDASPMPSGLTFSVQAFGYPDPPAGLFVHTTNVNNTGYNETWIDNPLTDDNPNATIFVTPNFNPGGHGTTYVDAPIGVYYDSSQSKWAIFTQNHSTMPIGAAFNVLVPMSPIY